MDRLVCMKTFLTVAETGGFSAAARALGTSTAMVSRRVGALERHLGIRLFNRSTRQVELSEAGETYYPRCCELLDQVDLVESEVTGFGRTPRGNLRISVPMDFGQLFLQPAIREFLSRYPEICLDVRFDDRQVDLVREQIDLAIRISHLPDSSLVSRKLGSACLGCYASPDYLAQHGAPQHPAELAQHQLLDYTLSRTPGRWTFEEDGQAFAVPVSGRLAANNSRVLAEAACLGLGIIRNPEFLVQDLLKKGRLIEVLTAFRSAPLDISMVYLHRRFRPATLTAFADFLHTYFKNRPNWGSLTDK
jgi:DNA-binding transcriptional LysR family regulator